MTSVEEVEAKLKKVEAKLEKVEANLEEVQAELKNDPSTITLLIWLRQLRMFILLIIVKLANIKLQEKEQSLQKDKESLQKEKQTLLDIQLELIKEKKSLSGKNFERFIFKYTGCRSGIIVSFYSNRIKLYFGA
jgi:uncharacterized protein YaaN involved in tellurite resistance